jgi:hypothetical protein
MFKWIGLTLCLTLAVPALCRGGQPPVDLQEKEIREMKRTVLKFKQDLEAEAILPQARKATVEAEKARQAIARSMRSAVQARQDPEIVKLIVLLEDQIAELDRRIGALKEQASILKQQSGRSIEYPPSHRLIAGVQFSNTDANEGGSVELFDQPEFYAQLQSTFFLEETQSPLWLLSLLQPEELELGAYYQHRALEKPVDPGTRESRNSDDETTLRNTEAVGAYVSPVWYVYPYNGDRRWTEARKKGVEEEFTTYVRTDLGGYIDTESSNDSEFEFFGGLGARLDADYELLAEFGYARMGNFEDEDRYALRGAWFTDGRKKGDAQGWQLGLQAEVNWATNGDGDDETRINVVAVRDLGEVFRSVAGIEP